MQYQEDALSRYKAFAQHYAGKAKIDDLIFAITPDASLRWAKLQKCECHVMPHPNPTDVPAMHKEANVTGMAAKNPIPPDPVVPQQSCEGRRL